MKATVTTLCVVIGAVAFVGYGQLSNSKNTSGANPSGTAKRKISCLGRLIPGDKVIQLAGPYSTQGPSIVKDLLVRRRDKVKKGDAVATLHTFDTAEKQVALAEAEVIVAERVLEQVKAGEKENVIAAQQAAVSRFEEELKSAEIFLDRDRELLSQKTISSTEFERTELAWRVSRRNYEQATNTLLGMKEVRQVDLLLAEARLTAARQTVNRMRAELAQATIRSPIDATVLDIRSYPGEILDRNPILELGDLDHMNVEAEVYVSDANLIRVGAPAVIRGDGFAGEVTGAVSEIGMQVNRSSIFDPDPASLVDKRIVKVWLKVNEAKKVSALINHQVTVVISP